MLLPLRSLTSVQCSSMQYWWVTATENFLKFRNILGTIKMNFKDRCKQWVARNEEFSNFCNNYWIKKVCVMLIKNLLLWVKFRKFLTNQLQNFKFFSKKSNFHLNHLKNILNFFKLLSKFLAKISIIFFSILLKNHPWSTNSNWKINTKSNFDYFNW